MLRQSQEPTITGRFLQETVNAGEFGTRVNYVDHVAIMLHDYIGVPKRFQGVTLTNCGQSAISCALLGHGIEPGDLVMVSPITYPATVYAITAIGAVPVYCDISPEDLMIDREQFGKICRSNRIKAVIPTIISGIAPFYTDVVEEAQSYGAKVIVDACQGIGSNLDHYENADALCFSFNWNKIITAGAGGAVFEPKYDVKNVVEGDRRFGFRMNLGMTALNAAILKESMETTDLSAQVELRSWSAARMRGKLHKSISVLGDKFGSCYWRVPIKLSVPRAAALCKNLEFAGIEATLLDSAVELHAHNYPVAKEAKESVVLLPAIYGRSQTDDIITAVNEFVCPGYTESLRVGAEPKEAEDEPPPEIEIVAEIGINHDGDIDRAARLTEFFLDAGATYVKFQVFDPTREASSTQYPEYIKRLQPFVLNWPELFKRLNEEYPGKWFATPFDPEDVNLLEEYDCPLYKIGSAEIDYEPLLQRVKATGKRVILSTGNSTLADIGDAVEILGDPTILHCVSAYPTPISELNLGAMRRLQELYPKCKIGLSDHTIGVAAPFAAVMMGAQMIEKHVTDDMYRNQSPDHKLSMEPREFELMVESIHQLAVLRDQGTDGIKEPQPCESTTRRYLCAGQDLGIGTVLSENILRGKKIGEGSQGIPTNQMKLVKGRRLRVPLVKDQPLAWEYLSEV